MYIDTQDGSGRGVPDTERKRYKTRKDYLCHGLRDSAFKEPWQLTRNEMRRIRWEQNIASGTAN